MSSLERLEALVANDELFALADAVPEPDPSAGGRPRMFPPYMWVLFDALLSVYGSARRVEAELAHPVVWAHLRVLIARRFPDDPDRWLSEEPMRRHHYTYGRTRWLTHPLVFASLRRIHREHAARQARQLGLLDPDGPGSYTHPDLSRMLYADGKVLTPLFKAKPGDTKTDKATGEVRQLRAEQDAALHFEGTGETAGHQVGGHGRAAAISTAGSSSTSTTSPAPAVKPHAPWTPSPSSPRCAPGRSG